MAPALCTAPARGTAQINFPLKYMCVYIYMMFKVDAIKSKLCQSKFCNEMCLSVKKPNLKCKNNLRGKKLATVVQETNLSYQIAAVRRRDEAL